MRAGAVAGPDARAPAPAAALEAPSLPATRAALPMWSVCPGATAETIAANAAVTAAAPAITHRLTRPTRRIAASRSAGASVRLW